MSQSKNSTITTIVLGVAIGLVGAYAGWKLFVQPKEIFETDSHKSEPLFHEHVDLAIVLDGEKIDLSLDKYQSTSYDYRDPDIHLHDGVGEVVHLHKPGVTLGEFFETLDMSVTTDCFTFDDGQEYCSNEEQSMIVLVNGESISEPTAYGFQDLDQILVYYGNTNEADPYELASQVTDDACIYSLTCPERGTPPAENCVADPNRPCGL